MQLFSFYTFLLQKGNTSSYIYMETKCLKIWRNGFFFVSGTFTTDGCKCVYVSYLLSVCLSGLLHVTSRKFLNLFL
jgi:hypothetical protein